MVAFEITVQINRPQQEVFDFVSDPAKDALYRKGAKVAEWTTEAPVGVGSTMRTVDRFMGRTVETVSEITMWDPPHKYRFSIVGGPFPAEQGLEFESIEGGTHVTTRGEIEFKGIFKPLEWLFGNQIKQQSQDDFDRLKRLLEGA